MEFKQWQRLETDDLWMKSVFTEDSYSIWLTDLRQLYAEELDADDFRWRAAKAKVPIDVDDPSNLETVLKILAQTVKDGELTVSREANRLRYMDLVAPVHLPKPLATVDWTFKLELQPDDKFRDAVSKPLLDRIDAFEQRESDLIHRLHDKDHAIEKLLDTLEKYSVDLADVFPSLAAHGTARRANGRRDAASHIPALQVFVKDAWLESIKSGKRYERPLLTERTESGAFEKVPSPTTVEMPTQPTQPTPTSGKEKRNRSSAIKRTLGGPQPATSDIHASDADTESEDAGRGRSPASSKSKTQGSGIRRTLERREKNSAVPPDSSTSADASEPEASALPPATKPKGIKRTLGSRGGGSKQKTISPEPMIEEEPSEEHAPRHARNQDQEPSAESSIDEEEAANRKRAELKRQLAARTLGKSKKRKF